MTSISHYGKCVPLLFWPMAILLVATGTSRTGATGRLVQVDSDSRVAARIDAGEIQGVRDSTTGVLVFRGIPFAAPPIGPLRWTPPKLPEAWQGTRQASTFGARCPQQVGPAGQGGDTPPATSEDCLTLNVWTTATNSRSRRPVLVWLHGGGGVGGSGAIPAQDGRALSQKGLVVVTVNYRLGLLGYLAHPALTAESPRHVSGNYALLDQVAALQWVQRNIARFAGDPALRSSSPCVRQARSGAR
jgi:para-nitrobenzyl esterase